MNTNGQSNGRSNGAAVMAMRLPPQNLEAERSVLGSCLRDADAIDVAAEHVRPGDFYRGIHTETFAVMLEMRDAGTEVDAVTLAEELIRRGRFESMGGDEYLRELVDSVPHAVNVEYYARIVLEKAMARGLIEAATATLRECYSNELTAQHLLASAEERVFALGERGVSRAVPASEFIDEVMRRFDARRAGRIEGLPSGFAGLDRITGGFQPGTLVVLAARPSQGKSALAMDVTRHVSRSGGSVLFVSLEMGDHELGDRAISSESGVPAELLRDPRFIPERHDMAIRNAADRLGKMVFWVDDASAKTVTEIAAQARRIKRRHGLSLLVIDYLGLIDGRRHKGESRQEEVARISRGLKGMARHLCIPVLALHQLNRKSEDREGRRPMLADLRDSGQVEADADLVLLIHRPEFYDPNDKPGVAELYVAKNRNGATGTVPLTFEKHCTRFTSPAHHDEQADTGAAY